MTDDQMADGNKTIKFIDCFRDTDEYNAQWKLLGSMLELKKSDLDTIECDNPRNSKSCRMEMLHVWLKTNPANPRVMLDNALKEIQKATCSKENDEAESWRLDDTVEKEIDKLKDIFATIVKEACQCLLKTHNQSAKLAAVWLNEILRGTQSEPLVVEKSARVSDFSDLFQQLQEKWSFTNTTFLQRLLKKLKDVSLIEKLDEFTKRFNTFCSKFPIDKATKPVCFEHYDSSQPCLVIILNFENFDEIKAFLKDVFDIYVRYLRVHMIKPGNIKEVIVQFTASMTTIVQDCIDQRGNNTSMHIEPPAEDTKKQPTAAPSAKYQTSEAAVHDMDNEPKMTEVSTQGLS